PGTMPDGGTTPCRPPPIVLLPNEAVPFTLAGALVLATLCACMIWATTAHTIGARRLALGFRLYWALAWLLPFVLELPVAVVDCLQLNLLSYELADAFAMCLYVWHALLSAWLVVLLWRLGRLIPAEQGQGGVHSEAS